MNHITHNQSENQKFKRTTKEHYLTPEGDLPKLDFQANWYDDADHLEKLVPSWNRLVDVAVQENPFLDPDFLIPAFRHLGRKNVKVLVIDAPNRKNPNADRVLCGLIPLEKKRFYRIPVTCYETWNHPFSFDQTPLIRRDVRLETLSFMLKAIQSLGCSLLSLETVSNESPFGGLLAELIFQNQLSIFQRDQFNRACFQPMEDSETYIRTKVSKNTRKSTKRLQRKLESEGKLELCSYFNKRDCDTWIEDFLKLESSGWKGENKTAMECDPSQKAFFLEMARRTIRNDKMAMTKVIFNGKTIGMLCDLHQKRQGAAFKTAFDESYSAYSPGLIAELNNIHRLHEIEAEKMDSCATPDHSMINRVWPDRIRLQSLVLATGGTTSKLAVAAMPMIQAISRLLKPSK